MDCAELSLPVSSVAADCDWDCETSQITTLAALLMFGKSSAAAAAATGDDFVRL